MDDAWWFLIGMALLGIGTFCVGYLMSNDRSRDAGR
jgi:hypothetical protein